MTLHNSSFHYNMKYVRGPHRGWGGVWGEGLITKDDDGKKCFHHESLSVSIICLSELALTNTLRMNDM